MVRGHMDWSCEDDDHPKELSVDSLLGEDKNGRVVQPANPRKEEKDAPVA